MAKEAQPVFWRDHQTGSMKQFTPSEPEDFARTHNLADPPHARVLVVDDDETDRRLTIWRLGKAWPAQGAMTVECAADSGDALDKIRRNRYDLVVLDWNMPQQDGGEVLQAMREDGLRVSVVVVSGQPREAIPIDLDSRAAGFANKKRLDAISLRNAIVASILLQEVPAQSRGRAMPGGADYRLG